MAAVIQLGAAPDLRSPADGMTALCRAVESAECGAAALLIDHGRCDPDARRGHDRGQTPLMLASLRGDAEMVALLLARGADVRAVDSSRGTALTLAFEHSRGDQPNYAAVARLLVDAGAGSGPSFRPKAAAEPGVATATIAGVPPLLRCAKAELQEVPKEARADSQTRRSAKDSATCALM